MTVIEMFEALFAIAAVVGVLVLVGVVVKLALALVLLPLKLGFFLLKGLVALLCVVPIVIVSVGIASIVPLMLLAVLGLPLLVLIGGVILLVKVFH